MGRGPLQGMVQPSGGPAWQGGAGIQAGRAPPALGTGPALYLASIVQSGGTLGGGD